jgi:hypothetical protein
MRLMAAKYQEKEEAAEKAAAAEALAANAAALFTPFLPYLPPAEKRICRPPNCVEENVPLDLSRGSTPELDVGGRDESAAADEDDDAVDDKAAVKIATGARRGSSSTADATVHTSWPVERVATFIEQIDECAEYGRLFRDEKIDGSCLGSLSLYHLTAVLRIKIGPALKILKAVQSLQLLA